MGVLNWLAIALLLPESLTPEQRAAKREAQAQEAAAASAQQASTDDATRASPLRRFLPQAAVSNPRVLLLLFLRVCWSIPFNALFTTFSLFLSLRFGLGTSTTGRVLAYAGVLNIACQALAVGPLTRRFSEDTLLLFALALGGVSLAAVATAPSMPLLCVALAPTALASSLFGTVASAALSTAAAPGQTGALLGVAFSVEAGTRVVAPVLAGALTTALGASAPGVLGAAVIAASLPVAATVMRAQARARAAIV